MTKSKPRSTKIRVEDNLKNESKRGRIFNEYWILILSVKVTSKLLSHYAHGQSTEWANSYAFIYLLHVLAVCINHHQAETQ